ncbi:hypothetical protein P154DRAFT_572227 [Amniculicola lignicola CBS 123094]|uniref:Uncharacterized protein n=1 Tax=Amniculicola lignicola CBS 123094 TaxID=1392246 RepID=A0A6A5WVL6_9PLEO|nr:hypothetical protein P154DRAFT_572227 [Amniculicola lignicola CBS 123094]
MNSPSILEEDETASVHHTGVLSPPETSRGSGQESFATVAPNVAPLVLAQSPRHRRGRQQENQMWHEQVTTRGRDMLIRKSAAPIMHKRKVVFDKQRVGSQPLVVRFPGPRHLAAIRHGPCGGGQSPRTWSTERPLPELYERRSSAGGGRQKQLLPSSDISAWRGSFNIQSMLSQKAGLLLTCACSTTIAHSLSSARAAASCHFAGSHAWPAAVF